MEVSKQHSKIFHSSQFSEINNELRNLEIDGYKIVFTRKVALLPVELADVKPMKKITMEQN